MTNNFTVIVGGLMGHLAGYPRKLFVDPEDVGNKTGSWFIPAEGCGAGSIWNPAANCPSFDVSVSNIYHHPARWFVSSAWVVIWLSIFFGGVVAFYGWWYNLYWHCGCFRGVFWWDCCFKNNESCYSCCKKGCTEKVCCDTWTEKSSWGLSWADLFCGAKCKKTYDEISQESSFTKTIRVVWGLFLIAAIVTGIILQFTYTGFLSAHTNDALGIFDRLNAYGDGVQARGVDAHNQLVPEQILANQLVDHCLLDGCPGAVNSKLQIAARNINQTQGFLDHTMTDVNNTIGTDVDKFSDPSRHYFGKVTFPIYWSLISLQFVILVILLISVFAFYGRNPKRVIQWLQNVCVWTIFGIFIVEWIVAILPQHVGAVAGSDLCTLSLYGAGNQFGPSRRINDYIDCTDGAKSEVTERLEQARTDLSLATEAAEALLTFENARLDTGTADENEQRSIARARATELQTKINVTQSLNNETIHYLLCPTVHNMGVEILNKICYNGLVIDSFTLVVSKYITLFALLCLIWILPYESETLRESKGAEAPAANPYKSENIPLLERSTRGDVRGIGR